MFNRKKTYLAVTAFVIGSVACAATIPAISGKKPASAPVEEYKPGIKQTPAVKPPVVEKSNFAAAGASLPVKVKPTGASSAVAPSKATTPAKAAVAVPTPIAVANKDLPPYPPMAPWATDEKANKEVATIIRETNVVDRQLSLAKKRKELSDLTQASGVDGMTVDSIGEFNSKKFADLKMSGDQVITVKIGDNLEDGAKVVAINRSDVVILKNGRRMVIRMNKAVLTSTQTTTNGMPMMNMR